MKNVLLNGEWATIPTEKLQIGTSSFGFQSGLYETLRTLDYSPVFLSQHLERLFTSAKKIGLEIEHTKQELKKMTTKIIQTLDNPNQRVRILATPKNLIIYTSKLNLNMLIYGGVSVRTMLAKRYSPDIKTTDYDTCLSAWKKAQEQSCFEAVLVNKKGDVFEGSRSNVFWVREGKIITREKEVLPGVTRQALLTKSPFSIIFGKLNKTDFRKIDELFITNSGSGIVPVTRVNDKNVGSGKVGKTTNKLLGLYDKWIAQDISELYKI